MKMKILTIAFITALSFSGCKDQLKDVADFSATSKAPYVELTSKAVLAVKQGATASVAIRSRENFQTAVTVTYDITGAFTASGTGTIARNTTAGTISVVIPANVVTGTATTADATITLKTATMGTQALTIGYLDPTAEKRIIRVSK